MIRGVSVSKITDMDNTNTEMQTALTLSDIFEKLAEILREELHIDEDKIELVKSRLMLFTVCDDKNRCKGVYKSGPKKGSRCETIVSEDSVYCKKHQPGNKMGIWAKNKSNKSVFPTL
jgi:hypothetical protein